MKGLLFFLTALSVISFARARNWSEIDYERCTDVLNKAVDYSLVRFLDKERYRSLPDADLGRLKLTNLLLSGLNTIDRRCDFHLTYTNGTVRAAGCVGAKQLRISMHSTIKLGFFSYTVYPGAVIQNLNLRFVASARMAKGAVGKLEVLNVDSWQPKLKFNGKLAIINWVFNIALKTALKDFIIDIVSRELVTVLTDLLQQHPL